MESTGTPAFILALASSALVFSGGVGAACSRDALNFFDQRTDVAVSTAPKGLKGAPRTANFSPFAYTSEPVTSFTFRCGGTGNGCRMALVPDPSQHCYYPEGPITGKYPDSSCHCYTWARCSSDKPEDRKGCCTSGGGWLQADAYTFGFFYQGSGKVWDMSGIGYSGSGAGVSFTYTTESEPP